jgi:hypothetical protein
MPAAPAVRLFRSAQLVEERERLYQFYRHRLLEYFHLQLLKALTQVLLEWLERYPAFASQNSDYLHTRLPAQFSFVTGRIKFDKKYTRFPDRKDFRVNS